jgi:hypothetical protein
VQTRISHAKLGFHLWKKLSCRFSSNFTQFICTGVCSRGRFLVARELRANIYPARVLARVIIATRQKSARRGKRLSAALLNRMRASFCSERLYTQFDQLIRVRINRQQRVACNPASSSSNGVLPLNDSLRCALREH